MVVTAGMLPAPKSIVTIATRSRLFSVLSLLLSTGGEQVGVRLCDLPQAEQWIIVLKTNGDETLAYSSPHWASTNGTLNADSQRSLPGNAKYPEVRETLCARAAYAAVEDLTRVICDGHGRNCGCCSPY
jgi:hypothetical protein